MEGRDPESVEFVLFFPFPLAAAVGFEREEAEVRRLTTLPPLVDESSTAVVGRNDADAS